VIFFAVVENTWPEETNSLFFQTPTIFNFHLAWDGKTSLLPMKTTLDPQYSKHWAPEIPFVSFLSIVSFYGLLWRISAGSSRSDWSLPGVVVHFCRLCEGFF
jgi:hypothetical protein